MEANDFTSILIITALTLLVIFSTFKRYETFTMQTVALLQETITEYTTGFPKISHYTFAYSTVALAQQELQRIAGNLSDKFAHSQNTYTDIYTKRYENANSFHIESDDLAYDLQVERKDVKNKAH